VLESSNVTLQTRLDDTRENHRVLRERMVATHQEREAQFDTATAALRIERDVLESRCEQEKQARVVLEGREDQLASTRDTLIDEQVALQAELQHAQAALARATEGRPIVVREGERAGLMWREREREKARGRERA
jgi:hypothetical protein